MRENQDEEDDDDDAGDEAEGTAATTQSRSHPTLLDQPTDSDHLLPEQAPSGQLIAYPLPPLTSSASLRELRLSSAP